KVRLLDPDGKPVSRARFLCRLPVASLGFQQLYPAEARDGWLELRGCDTERTYPVYILDSINQRGALVQISGKQAAGAPPTVRLAPCGSAVISFVDGRGKPVGGYRPNAFGMEILIRGGADPEPERVRLLDLDRRHHSDRPVADGQGRYT